MLADSKGKFTPFTKTGLKNVHIGIFFSFKKNSFFHLVFYLLKKYVSISTCTYTLAQTKFGTPKFSLKSFASFHLLLK